MVCGNLILVIPLRILVAHNFFYQNSLSVSRMTCTFENEINILIPLCNVRHLNGILKMSLKSISEKDTLTEKKIKNILVK